MEKKKSYFNLPNALSFYRIISAPFLVWLAFLGEKQWFTWLILFSFFTDMADGFIARRWNLSSKLGAQLDSVGDALTFVTAVFGVWQFEYAFLMEHKIVVLIAFVPYLLQILLAITIYGRPSSFHTYMAKTAALVQGVFSFASFSSGRSCGCSISPSRSPCWKCWKRSSCSSCCRNGKRM